jgi:hypothetical protein
MGHLYRSEVSWSDVTIAGPSLDATQFGTRASLFLGVFDGNASWAIEARLAYHAYFDGITHYEYQTQYFFYFGPGNDPATGSFVSGTFFLVEADGQNGASYKAGGTLAIEKEVDADELRFVTPLGTVTHALSSFETPDDSRLRVDSMAHQFVRPNLLSASGSEEAKWFDFFSKEDGTPFRGTAMSSTDPGSWTGWNDVTFGFPTGAIATKNDGQEATRYRTHFEYTGGSHSSGSREYRNWTGGDSLNASADSLIDMIHAGEHGAHALIYVPTTDRTQLLWQRTHDKLVTAPYSGAVYTGGTNASPSIVWAFGKFYVAWETGGSILLSVSSDLATTWTGAPMTIATGTNPKLLTDPQSGFSWLFYCSGSDLYLIRSGNFFTDLVDGSPILVASGVGAQTVAAQQGLDEGLVVAYQSSGSVISLRSSDMGRTWGA